MELYIYIYIYAQRGQVAWTTKFCPGAPNIYGLPVRNLVYVTSLVPKILVSTFLENVCSAGCVYIVP